MATTVHPNPDTESHPQHEHLVERIVAQLRGTGVQASDQAVRVLAIHAHRRELDTGDLVAILGRFEVARRWPADVRRRAAELLTDIGLPADQDAVDELEMDTAIAWRASLDGPAPASWEQPGADEDSRSPDLARAELVGTIDGILASAHLSDDCERVAKIREAYERYRAGCTEPATAVVEAYSPREDLALGSLDRTHYACAAHIAATERMIHAAGMTPYRSAEQVAANTWRCGDVWDHTNWDYSKGRPVGQSKPEPLRLCATCGEPVEYVTEGPDPGWWRHVDVIGGQPHAARPGPAM